MNETRPLPRFPLIAGVVATGIVAALAAAAFSGWISHGPAILLTMAESGLSWCF
ncbi:MAG: hypothetical protein QHC90_04705 [Shinella sp.]|nr:hypothetical protein [Shinella sp.]